MLFRQQAGRSNVLSFIVTARQIFNAFALAACFCWAVSAAAAPPVEDFFKPDAYDSMVMSPSGKRIAGTVPNKDGRRILAVIDIADPSKTKAVAAYSDADIWHVAWVNDDRLVFTVRDLKSPLAVGLGRGLFAVDAQGNTAARMLIKPVWAASDTGTHIRDRALQPDHVFHSVIDDGSNDVLVQRANFSNTGEITHWTLLRLNTTTGIAVHQSAGASEGVVRWIVDAAGAPRAVVAETGGKSTLYWRAEASDPWVRIGEGSRYTSGVIQPMYIDPAGTVFARARVAPDRDVASLVSMKIVDGKPEVSTLLSIPGFDFGGVLIRNGAGSVIGVNYVSEAPAQYWYDKRLSAIQAKVDALLPATNNLLDCGHCDQLASILVTSSSDRQPTVYRLFDVANGQLEPLAVSRPWIDSRQMAKADMVRIPTRDGMSMPLHITLPNGPKAAAPMVVLVHGGPWVRGSDWEWNNEPQFLASRGYVVVEPEFRGSTGFGFRWYRSGFKQWGLTMQDDVADAALWAIKEGYADPKRVCIAGASYGGYATLMGLARNPEIFRCGVEWVGVTDIDLMYSITWSDTDDAYKQFGMPALIGDPQKDAAQLAATSPLRLADKIKQPLFMAYGGIDERVPIKHGIEFRDAVTKTNPNVEWKVYSDEGHGWVLPANTIDFWTRVEKFLDKNLKNPQP